MADTLKAFSPEDADRIERVVQWAERLMRAPAFGPRGAAPVIQDGGDRLVKVTSATAGDHGLYPAKLQDGVWTWLDPSFPADADAPDCWLMMRNVELAEVGKTYFARRLSLHDDGSLIYCYASPDPDPFISVDGTSPGTGDSAVAAFQVKTLHVYLGSGLGIANPSTGVGEISLQPASHTHAGGVDLTDGQWLGAGAKLVDKVQVGVGSLQAWPTTDTRALVKGKLCLTGDFVGPPVEIAELRLRSPGSGFVALGRILLPASNNLQLFAGTEGSADGLIAEIFDGSFNLTGVGAYHGVELYSCGGHPGINGTTGNGDTITGGIITGAGTGGMTGTIGG